MFEITVFTEIAAKKNRYRVGTTKQGKAIFYRARDEKELTDTLVDELWKKWRALKQAVPIEKPVRVQIVLRKKRGDPINYAETILDALQEATVLKNDSLVYELVVKWDYKETLENKLITAKISIEPFLMNFIKQFFNFFYISIVRFYVNIVLASKQFFKPAQHSNLLVL